MDLQDKVALGAAMFGTPSVNTGASTMLAEVVSDAKDGEVAVWMRDEEGNEQKVEIPCDGDLREGDVATVIVQDGRATAISAGGAGERSKAETEAAQQAATDAQTDATQAKTDAADAKETAAGAETAAGEAKDAAADATQAASDAQSAADTAKSAADAATSAATDASTKADAASTKADAATSAAADAGTKADAAQTTANTAQQAATDAQTDATNAAKAASDATDTAIAAKTTAETAQTTAQTASDTAAAAKEEVMATKQHFWADDEGAHVATTAHEEGAAITGSNLLATSDGVQIRDGETALSEFSANSASLNKDHFVFKSDENMVPHDGALTGAYDNVLELANEDDVDTSFYLRIKCGTSYYPIVWSYLTNISSTPLQFTQITSENTMTMTGQQLNLKGESCYIGDDTTGNLHFKGSDVKVNGTDIMLLAYPVGSIYMSVNSTSPADLFGGTWEEIAGGRVLMGQSDDYAAGTTGGSATHTHTGPAHTHTMAHTHTGPAHTHAYGARFGSYYGLINTSNSAGSTFDLWNGSSWVAGKSNDTTSSLKINTGVNAASATKSSCSTPYCKTVTGSSGTGNTGAASNATTSSSGTGNTGSASSLPPYLAVYMWKRTA